MILIHLTVLYIIWLGLWPKYEYLKSIFYVEPEEAKEWDRMRLRSRGNIIPPNVDIRAIGLELYDHLIIHSLTHHQRTELFGKINKEDNRPSRQVEILREYTIKEVESSLIIESLNYQTK